MARMTLRIFSRLPSVAPTHFDRKFFSLIVVSPHSLREGLGHERLARSHRPGEEDAHRHARGLAVADAAGDHQQVLLHLLHAADDFEAVLGLDELDQAEAFALQDLALAAGDEAVDLLPRAVAAVGDGALAGCAPGASSFAISS